MKRFLKTALAILLTIAVIISTAGCSTMNPTSYRRSSTGIAEQAEDEIDQEAEGVVDGGADAAMDGAMDGVSDEADDGEAYGDEAVSHNANEKVSGAALSGDETDAQGETAQNVFNREDKLSQVPHYDTRYYISQFEGELLDNFCLLYEATKEHKESCSFINKVTKDELDAMIFALKYDCPELFCLKDIRTYYHEGDAQNSIIKVNIEYLMDADEYEGKLEEAQRTIQQILDMENVGAHDKNLAVYEFLTQQCSYNLQTRNCGNAYGALVEKQTKCDGISLAYKWILEEMGEDCFVVAGTMPGDTLGHGWNVVKQGDNYYASDLTADLSDTFMSGKSGNWYPAYNVTTDWVESLYTISETPAFFEHATGKDMSQSYHVKNGTFCGVNDDEYRMIYNAIEKAGYTPEEDSMLQFETDELYQVFLNEYKNVMEAWATDNQCTNVEYTYSTIEGYRTVKLIVKAEFLIDEIFE